MIAIAAAQAPAVVGDAMPGSLTGRPGDPARGRAVALDRALGHCLLCHRLPAPQERFPGDIGPDLGDVGARLTPGQIRLRVVDAGRLNPATVMPPYFRSEGLRRVAPEHRGRPILSAEQVEDLVAYLATLRAER